MLNSRMSSYKSVLAHAHVHINMCAYVLYICLFKYLSVSNIPPSWCQMVHAYGKHAIICTYLSVQIIHRFIFSGNNDDKGTSIYLFEQFCIWKAHNSKLFVHILKAVLEQSLSEKMY